MARPKRDARQVLAEAKQIAADHNLHVVEKTYGDKTAYLLHRRLPHRLVFLGSRKSPAGLRSYVCDVAGFR